MDQVHVIRHKVLVEGVPIRRVAREMGVSRNTVRRYLGQSEPARRETAPRRCPVQELVGPRIEAILAESPRWTGGKQRLTAARLHEMLLAEGYSVGATVVKEAVAEWRRRRQEVFVPLVYAPGDLAEVDFFEVLVDVGAERRRAWMFVMRLMYSGRDFAWLYERQDQVSFLDGHVRAFAHFAAVPHRIAYDNLRAAVVRLLVGSERELTRSFQALCSHYLFEPCFCRPATGHDKGGVEARGKAIRWQELVPIPRGEDLGSISTALLARLDERQLHHKRDGQDRLIAELFAEEYGRMLPLGEYPFSARRTHFPEASRRSLAKVEGALYSVPSDWAGRTITAHVGAEWVEFVGPGTEPGSERIVAHRRLRFGQRSIDYRHYVRELARKPQALRQVAAELVRDLGEPFGHAWRHLVDLHGPKQASRVFARILAHIEHDGFTHVAHRIAQALEHGEPLLLAVASTHSPLRTLDGDSVPERLRGIEVSSGNAADYDVWLGGGRS